MVLGAGSMISEQTCVAETKECQKAKISYMSHMESVEKSKVNAFSIIDINQDGIPELLEGYMYDENSNMDQQLTAVYTYSKGKMKKLTNKLFRAEGSLKYSPLQKMICLYGGGTTNMFYLYKMSKNKLKSVGQIGYVWTDETCMERKPQKNGKWITDTAYNDFFKKTKSIELVTNTAEHRKLYLKNQCTIQCITGDSFSVKPKVADSRSIKYFSSRKSVVRVNSKGKVSVRKKGNAVMRIEVKCYGRKEVYKLKIRVK